MGIAEQQTPVQTSLFDRQETASPQTILHGCLFLLVIARVAPALPDRGPDIRFEKDEYDFGIVGAGEERTHTFRFRNDGNENLIIKGIRTTCGCTSALLKGESISPGDAGSIEVTLKVGSTTRVEKSSMYIHSNDPDEPILTIRMRAKVLAGVGFVPSRISVGDVPRDARIHRIVKLVNTWGEELRLIGIETFSENIEATAQDTLVPGRGETAIQIVIGPGLPEGQIDAGITVYTDNDKQLEISLPIAGNVISVNLFPKEFFFGGISNGSQVSRAVMISGIGENPVEISEVKTEMDFVKISVSRMKDSRYRIMAKLCVDDLQAGEITGSVDVYIVNRELPVRIPVQALVR